MRFLFALFGGFTFIVASSLTLSARADEPLRSVEARAVDTRVEVGLGVQGYGGNAGIDDAGAVEPYVRGSFGLVDPDHRIHRGFLVRDDLYGEIGAIGAKNAGGCFLTSVGLSLLPGFRFGDVALFFGPSARASLWMSGNHTSHVFTQTTLPFEARLEMYDSPFADLPRVVLGAWYAPWPVRHQEFGGRLEVKIADDQYLFFSIDHTEGLEHEKEATDTSWSDAAGVSWDGRFGLKMITP